MFDIVGTTQVRSHFYKYCTLPCFFGIVHYKITIQFCFAMTKCGSYAAVVFTNGISFVMACLTCWDINEHVCHHTIKHRWA